MSVALESDAGGERAFPVTRNFADWTAAAAGETIPESAYEWAKHALLDWFGVTIAGGSEPLSQMLAEEFGSTGGACTLVGLGRRASLHDAALVNGSVSHALDYDDVNRRLHGHPTVCVAAAALATGEALGSSGRELLTAMIVGTEVACNLGERCDEGHYEAGYHATGTMGTFGAAAAAARLMGLDGETTARAFGIAASQAAGLKCNFGTMTKPLHAGKAAMNGVMAARLAARGFTANPGAIEAPQGFADTQVPGFDAGAIRPDPERTFAIEEMLFKYHAACYLTHATLEAIARLRADEGVSLDAAKRIRLRFRPTHLSVCCIPAPATGLEIKFSIAHLAVMALAGIDTAALASYSDENARDPRLVAAREEKVVLEPDAGIDRMAAVVEIETTDGRFLRAQGDVGRPSRDTGAQWRKLCDKFDALVAPVAGTQRAEEIRQQIAALDGSASLDALLRAAR